MDLTTEMHYRSPLPLSRHATRRDADPKESGWLGAIGPVTVETIPMAHATLLEEPHVRVLGSSLINFLANHMAARH